MTVTRSLLDKVIAVGSLLVLYYLGNQSLSQKSIFLVNPQSMRGGGVVIIGPSRIKKAVELNVGLTSNQAVHLRFFILSRSLKKLINMDLKGILEGLHLVRVP